MLQQLFTAVIKIKELRRVKPVATLVSHVKNVKRLALTAQLLS